MSSNANKGFLERMFEHVVDLERYAASQVKKVKQRVGGMMERVISTVAWLNPSSQTNPSRRDRRTDRAADAVSKISDDAYNGVAKWLDGELPGAMQMEEMFMRNALTEEVFLGVKGMVYPGMSEEEIRAAVESRTILSHPAADWWDEQNQGRKTAFIRELRYLMAQGASLDQLIRELRRKGGWEDRTRQQMESLVRMEIAEATNVARQVVYSNNAGLVDSVEHVSVLDNRTTAICIARDGLQWVYPDLRPIGHNVDFARPPLHFNCRSVIMGGLADATTLYKGGSGYTRSEYERLLREQSPPRRGETPEQYEGRIGQTIERQRHQLERRTEARTASKAKEMEQFLRADRKRAEQMIGKTAANLFFQGRMDLKDLINAQSNRPLTQEELRKKYGGNPSTR